MKRVFFLVACIFYSSAVMPAVIPESGFWHVDGWRGLGFSIEVQGDSLFVVTYAYNAEGDPLFYTSTGNLDPNTNTFTSSLDVWRNGYCLNCTYAPADNQGSVGPITITFLTPSTATVSWPGAMLNIQRFRFGHVVSEAFDGIYYGAAIPSRTVTSQGGQCGGADIELVVNGTQLSGNALDVWGRRYTVEGMVDLEGNVNFVMAYAQGNVATVTGTFGSGSGSGSWEDVYGCQGTWEAQQL